MHRVLMTIVLLTLSVNVNALGPIPPGTRLTPMASPNVNITGTIVDPMPCKVNNEIAIDVEFDSVIISDIDGVNFSRNIPITVDCLPNFTGELNLIIKGEMSELGSSVIKTNVNDLGITISKAGVPIEINKAFPIEWRTAIQLQAAPIKKAGSSISGGEFSATATLLVTVQ